MVGVGNVALDVARILTKHAEELADTDMADEVLDSLDHKQVSDVHVLGRRGPAYTAFTTKELRELGQIPDLDLLVDPLDLELDASSLAVRGAGQGRGPQPRGAPGVGRSPPGAGVATRAPALLDPARPDPGR